MNLHLAEIAVQIAPGAHAALLVDQAGWHLTEPARHAAQHHLESRCRQKSPELNPQENVWQFLPDNWLSNRIFKSYDDVVDHCCEAWNNLVNQPLEDHVHRPARLGPWVLISESWYKPGSDCRVEFTKTLLSQGFSKHWVGARYLAADRAITRANSSRTYGPYRTTKSIHFTSASPPRLLRLTKKWEIWFGSTHLPRGSEFQ